MDTRILADPDAVALEGARIIAAEARAAVAARGRFVLALSGGRTPWMMLRALADQDVPWSAVHLVQVDERMAPEGHPDRNLTQLHTSLLAHVPVQPVVHPMPVGHDSADGEALAREYGRTLAGIGGTPPVLDLVHLGLGPDGHTASLVPGDSALDLTDRDVAVTSVFQGRRRMTLTYPVLNRSRRVLWIVTGADKAAMLRRLLAADPTIPGGRVRQDRALLLADRDAAGGDAHA